jgi:hypothetical protein
MMVKFFYFLTTLLFFLTSSVCFGNETIEGKMSCKILSQSIIEMDDGQLKTYKGYMDGLEVGDSFDFIYLINKEGLFVIKIDSLDDNFSTSYDFNILNSIAFGDVDGDYELSNSYSMIEISEEYGLLRMLNRPFGSAHLHTTLEVRKNSLSFGYAEQRLNIMNRYYKSDWMGITTDLFALKDQPISNHNYSYVCMHTVDKWDEVYEKIMEYALERKKSPLQR